MKFRRGDLVRIGWVTEAGLQTPSAGPERRPLLGLVTGFNVRYDFNGNARTEVISRAFFNGLEYITHPDAIVKVSK